jgi:hypothetical protein
VAVGCIALLQTGAHEAERSYVLIPAGSADARVSVAQQCGVGEPLARLNVS